VRGLEFRNEANAINDEVRELSGRGVKAIVVALHQGSPQAPDAATGAALEEPMGGLIRALDSAVDVVISGHAHAFTNSLVETDRGATILVTQAFSYGTAYGEIDLDLERASGDVVQKSARIVTTFGDPSFPRDPAVQKLVNAARAKVAAGANRAVTQIAGDATRAQNSAGESTLGNRAAMRTDFAFMHAGGIRGDLRFAADGQNPEDADGKVSWGELFAIQPFGDNLVRMDLSGANIVALLEQQWLGQPVPRHLQVSGLTYTWDAARPDGHRIVQVAKGGVPLDAATLYAVTVTGFLAAGGDNFSVLTSGLDRAVGPNDLDAWIAYMQNAPQPLAIPALGRITRKN
jgi:5'-nucleotidase